MQLLVTMIEKQKNCKQNRKLIRLSFPLIALDSSMAFLRRPMSNEKLTANTLRVTHTANCELFCVWILSKSKINCLDNRQVHVWLDSQLISASAAVKASTTTAIN